MRLVQWLSDITSSPTVAEACNATGRVHQQNRGSTECQLRRGIEPRLHKLGQNKPKSLKKRQSTQNGNRVTCAVDQLRSPSTRKPHNTTKSNNNLGSPTHWPESPRSQAITERTDTYLRRGFRCCGGAARGCPRVGTGTESTTITTSLIFLPCSRCPVAQRPA